MATLPGFFSTIKLGDVTVTDPGDKIDIAGLNVAVVMCEDDAPVEHRFTTWGLQADSTTLYQTLSDKNKIIIGNAGYVYALREMKHDDDGVGIPVVWESGPLPEVDDKEPITAQHRLHSISWQIKTPPPVVGHAVTVKITDMDNPANYMQVTVYQTETKTLLPITVTARQFRIRLSVTTTQDFDPISFGYKYQTLQRPYWREQ